MLEHTLVPGGNGYMVHAVKYKGAYVPLSKFDVPYTLLRRRLWYHIKSGGTKYETVEDFIKPSRMGSAAVNQRAADKRHKETIKQGKLRHEARMLKIRQETESAKKRVAAKKEMAEWLMPEAFFSEEAGPRIKELQIIIHGEL